jgi:hypothetical protein
MAAKTTRASVEKVRRGIQERTGVTPTARHSEIPSLKSTANTEQVLRDLGQTDVARGSNTFSVEAAKKGSPITSGFVNAYADNPKLAAAASFLTGSSVANDIFRQRQSEAMKGTLTNEMKSAGLTQADIDTWNAEQNEKERQQVMSQWAKEHPIMTTLNAIPENAFGSIEGNINKAIDYVKGNPIQSKETNADIYRRSVSENINSGLGRGAYGVANSIGDMLFAAWLTGGLGGGGATQGAKGLAKLLRGLPAAGVMGLEKSNQVMNDASERGLSNNQIAAEGLLSGASTALTEALPFSKFGEGGHIVGSMLAEGLQEGSEDLLDTFFDELVTRVGGNGNKSDLSTRYRQYLSAGYNADEARKAVTTDYIKQVIMDTLAGGAAGGAMGGLGNFISGRNVITGKIPSLNTEENTENVQQAKTEEDIEAEDYLRSILEEANQMEINPENIRLDEQTQQQAPETQQIPKVKQTVDYDWSQNVYGEAPARNIDTDTYRQYAEGYNAMLREYGITDNSLALADDINKAYDNIVSAETATQQQDAIERFNYLINLANETLENRTDDLYINNRGENQPVQPTIPSLTNRQLAQYTRQVEGLIDKLGMFGNKSFNKSLNNALKAVQNTQGEEQQNAIASLNNLVNQIDEQMAGSEIGTSQRTINQDMYDDMKRVTDGYVVKVNDNMLNEMGLTLKQLNDRVNTTARDGVNHIRFVKGNSGTPIDSVYNELYELSNHQLPDPRSMAEGDQLKAVYDYVTRAKSGKNEMAQTATWENVPVLDNRTKAEVDMESQTDAILDKIANGTVTDEDYDNFLDSYSKAYFENFDKPSINAINDMMDEVKQAYSQYVENVGLDEDIANIQTAEDVNNTVADGLKNRRMNLEMFSGSNANTNTASDEEYGRVNTGRFKTSKNFTNTGSKVLTPKEKKLLKMDKSMEYEENGEAESMQAASDRLIQNGFENEFKRLINKDKGFNNVDVDEMFKLRRSYVEEALDLEARGQDAKDAWNRAKQCFEKLQDMATDHATGLQAYAKWSRNNTADGLLHQVTTVVNRFRNGEQLGVSGRKELKRTDFQKQLEKLDKVKLSDEFVEEFTRIARQIEDMAENGIDTSVDPRALEPMNKLGKMVDSLLPSSLPEKVKSYLILNMLGNPRTLLSRNFGGNVGFNTIEDFLRKPVSYLVDQALSKVTGKQTIAKPTAAIYNAGKEGFIYGLSRSVKDLKENVHTARSGENTLQNAAVNNRKVFTDPVFGTYERLVNFGLDVGDRGFYEKAYRMAIEEGKQLYKQGAFRDSKGNIISEAEFNALNKIHAMDAGLEAVYQDDTLLSDAFLGFKENIGKISKSLLGVDILSQFSMPFVKTPANIIYRSIEYSPLGLVKNALQTIREVNRRDANNNKIGWKEGLNQERIAKETARNLVGSALFFIAMGLAKSGTLTGGYSDNDKVKQAQKEAGMQEYALHTNNGDYDISWLPVLGNDMYSAAAVYDAIKDPNLSAGEALTKGLSAGVGSQFSASMLQGLQRLFGANGYTSGSIADNMVNTVLSGTTQVAPSIFRQIAAVGDPYQRSNYGPGFFDQYINSLRASLPWSRQNLEPRVGLTGEYRQQNPGENLAEKIFSNMISPAGHTVGTADAVRDEAMRLYDITGNVTAFEPYLTKNDLKDDSGQLPDAATLREFQETAYTAMNQAATQMINSDFYAGLSDGEKETVLGELYSAIKSVEKANILGKDKDNLNGAAKAYNTSGAEGLLDYLTASSILRQTGMTNNEKNREHALEMLNNGGAEAVQAMYDQSQELADAGFDSNMQFKYEHAANYIPSLSPTQFADIWNAVNTDNNTTIKQAEVIDYLNQNPSSYNDNTALQYWYAFDQHAGDPNNQWKSIPVLNPDTGLWEAKSGTSTTTTDDIGQYGAGNIDLYNRPQYIQPDGSVSTVNSMSINDGGMEVLIPTIAYDNYGRPYQMTDQEAINHYYQTGEYLGKFKTVQEADAYAEKLHQQQERLYA